jgi:chemotaxis protein methyltransferase CheR
MSGTTTQQSQPVLKDSEFRKYQRLMYDHAGIQLNESKHALVQNRLRKRLRLLGLTSYEEYFKLVVDPAHPEEFQECMNALTTNETYFFRHKNHWDFFTGEFIPELKAARQGKQLKEIRLWSAAASVGAEAYSAAIAVEELLPEEQGWSLTIDATDLNVEVLRQAREGRFNAYAVQKLTKHCLTKYFALEGQEYVVREKLRAKVNFRRHNLLEEMRGACYDLVFLRNVLIYFDEASKSRVVDNVANRIRKGGYLILGGAESLTAHRERFEYVKPTIFRKI